MADIPDDMFTGIPQADDDQAIQDQIEQLLSTCTELYHKCEEMGEEMGRLTSLCSELNEKYEQLEGNMFHIESQLGAMHSTLARAVDNLEWLGKNLDDIITEVVGGIFSGQE